MSKLLFLCTVGALTLNGVHGQSDPVTGLFESMFKGLTDALGGGSPSQSTPAKTSSYSGGNSYTPMSKSYSDGGSMTLMKGMGLNDLTRNVQTMSDVKDLAYDVSAVSRGLSQVAAHDEMSPQNMENLLTSLDQSTFSWEDYKDEPRKGTKSGKSKPFDPYNVPPMPPQMMAFMSRMPPDSRLLMMEMMAKNAQEGDKKKKKKKRHHRKSSDSDSDKDSDSEKDSDDSDSDSGSDTDDASLAIEPNIVLVATVTAVSLYMSR